MIQETVNILLSIEPEVDLFCREIKTAYNLTGMMVTAGNGGSATTASHLAGDLLRRGEFCICLTDNSAALTALSNDYSYEDSLDMLTDSLKTNYCLLLFSVSGESPNLVNLAKKANRNDIPVFSVLGRKDSTLESFSIKSLIVPNDDYGIVESIHLLIAHKIANEIRGLEE